MNNYPKYVVSSKLQDLKWQNSILIKENIVEEISKLKQKQGWDILDCGSSELVNILMQYDLIDEYRFIVFPVVLGRVKRLFKDNIGMKMLQHVDTKHFSQVLVY
jgi:dihydrofolate reductase